MKQIVLTAVLLTSLSAFASISVGQDVDDASCKQIIENTCTRCHSVNKICKELDNPRADWPGLVRWMGSKGNISQQDQKAALDCLTKSSDPKKIICSGEQPPRFHKGVLKTTIFLPTDSFVINFPWQLYPVSLVKQGRTQHDLWSTTATFQSSVSLDMPISNPKRWDFLQTDQQFSLHKWQKTSI